MNIRKIASLGLAVALQVLPITRVFVAATPATGSSFAIISTWIAGALALMGGLDAVSGASTTITSAKTARGTNGVAFSYRITTGPDVANTYAAAPLPTGLIVNTSSGRITGTPSVSGVFVIGLTASDSGQASRTVRTNLTLTIVDGGGGGAVAPAITTQPVSQSVTAGGNVSFTVAASGTAPLTYQWKLGGVNVSGGTSATLSLTGVTAGQAGSYTCVVGNSAGSATSSAATLTVTAAVVAPTITTQPVSQSVTAGGNVSFTVAASGTAPLTYQWKLGGVNVSGGTSATLSLTGVTAGQAGSYTCVVGNSAGSATSSAATLTVTAAVVAPTITTQPVSQSVTAGGNVSFTVAASGTAPLTYQWKLGGVNVSGGTSATLSLTGVTAGQAGSYTCVVGNSAGSATSSAATLTVTAAVVAPTITTQPVSQSVTAGGNVSFTVAASGTAPLTYQWKLGGVNVSGGTSATLSLTGVTAGQAGSYTCVVGNSAGSATSSAATLTVTAAVVAPTITTQPVSQSVTAGGNVSFTVAASGTAPLTYQWKLGGVNVSGGTSATLSLTGVTAGQAGSYTCVVGNSAGSATSSAATLTVTAAVVAPTITTQPVSQSVTAGGNVSFTVAASGTAPLTYQWKLGAVNVSGGTSATLSLTGVTAGQAGSYTCVVGNSAGSATSSAATLTVQSVAPQPTTLTLIIQGQGTVTPNLNAAGLTLGQTYTMTAAPATGYEFAGWSGNVQAVQSASATLTFVMASNLVVQASFVPMPYTAGAGTYNGLFMESDEVRLASAGTFKVHADGSGNYSGWVQLGYARYAFAGKLDLNLHATSFIPRWNGNPLTVELLVGQGGQVGQISGRVTDGVWNSPLSGGRATGSSPYAGNYTLVIPGLVGDARIPAGDGYATLSVGTDGSATMNGTLADGTMFMQTAMVTDDGDWPVYVSLYSGKGAVVSWMNFADLSSSDVSGTLVWIKQAGASAVSYPAGFTHETKAVGSLYVAPSATGKALNLSTAEVGFSGGELGGDFSNEVSINTGSQMVNLSPNTLTLTIAPLLGSFTGQVQHPGSGMTHNFGGVVLQKQNAGYGFITGVNASSRVVFAAPLAPLATVKPVRASMPAVESPLLRAKLERTPMVESEDRVQPF